MSGTPKSKTQASSIERWIRRLREQPQALAGCDAETSALISDYLLNLFSEVELLNERLEKTRAVLNESIPETIEFQKALSTRTQELEAVNRELEAFSYSVSHDLRAPLRHIEGCIELLKDTRPSPEEKVRYLDAIDKSAKQMGRLIDDLLRFSQISRAALRKSKISLTELVQAVIRDLGQESLNREIQWVIGELPEVEADSTLLRQAVTNLLGNALKYTRTRERTRIEIGCNSTESEHIIFIKDNGVGFDMRFVNKLFGVFQRLHRAEAFDGTGVGLAMVRRIINRHGGRTWAEGEVDKGATFSFSLPNS